MAMMKRSSGIAHPISKTSWGRLKAASVDHKAPSISLDDEEEEKKQEEKKA